MSNLSEELREYTAMKYAGDCKCGKCQLVPRELIDRILPALRDHAPERRMPAERDFSKAKIDSNFYMTWPKEEIEPGRFVDVDPSVLGMTGEEFTREKEMAAWMNEATPSTAMTNRGLLPCPFCGKAPKCSSAHGEDGSVAICFECPDGCSVSRDKPSYDDAVAAWNTRIPAVMPSDAMTAAPTSVAVESLKEALRLDRDTAPLYGEGELREAATNLVNAMTAAPATDATTWNQLRELWIAISGQGPRCRDCADSDGTCCNDKEKRPCDPHARALFDLAKLKAAMTTAPVTDAAEALRRIRDFPHNDSICEQAMAQIAREALSAPRHERLPPQPDADRCDCENPEPASGVALVSEDCPIHGRSDA